MRIALMIHALYGGGAERLMADLANRWCKEHEVRLITWSRTETDNYPVDDSVQRIGLDLLRNSSNPVAGLLANIGRVRQLRNCLKQISPDFLLSFSDRTNIVTLEAARGMNCPVWISEHSDPARQRLGFVWENWRRRVYPNCTGCTVLTPGIAQTMSQWVSPSRIRVIPPAIHSTTSTHKTPPEPANRVLFLGRLSSEKRVDFLLDAWRMAAPQLPEWDLDIVGDGPLREPLEAQARELPRVHFSGWVDAPSVYLARARVFALCSEYEGFPVSLLEAMNHNTACLSTRCTTAIDLLNEEGQCVVSINPDSPEEYATQLIRVCTEVDLQNQLSTAGKNRVQDFYWEQVGPLWDQLLN